MSLLIGPDTTFIRLGSVLANRTGHYIYRVIFLNWIPPNFLSPRSYVNWPIIPLRARANEVPLYLVYLEGLQLKITIHEVGKCLSIMLEEQE